MDTCFQSLQRLIGWANSLGEYRTFLTMANLISISEVAKAMGWTYHQARNRLRKNPEAKKLSHKVGHAVCYEAKVLEVISEAS